MAPTEINTENNSNSDLVVEERPRCSTASASRRDSKTGVATSCRGDLDVNWKIHEVSWKSGEYTKSSVGYSACDPQCTEADCSRKHWSKHLSIPEKHVEVKLLSEYSRDFVNNHWESTYHDGFEDHFQKTPGEQELVSLCGCDNDDCMEKNVPVELTKVLINPDEE